jgi:hypothetical protein
MFTASVHAPFAECVFNFTGMTMIQINGKSVDSKVNTMKEG